MRTPPKRIDTLADLDEALDILVECDPRLAPIRQAAGPIPLRRTAPGFASLVSIVVSQQVSRASADAIFARLNAGHPRFGPEQILVSGATGLAACGLSRPKQRTVLAIAEAVVAGTLNLDELHLLVSSEALAALTRIHGVGPWTAQIYLLFALGHPDMFPAGDLALQAAAADGLRLPRRPGYRELAAIAESWSPVRGAAARLLWAHHARMRRGSPLPLP